MHQELVSSVIWMGIIKLIAYQSRAYEMSRMSVKHPCLAVMLHIRAALNLIRAALIVRLYVSCLIWFSNGRAIFCNNAIANAFNIRK